MTGLGSGALRFGGDYNPEQWDRSVWAEDVALMVEAEVNTVVLGVFSWSSLEPAEGRYTLDWLGDVLDLLHAAGVGAILATPTASPPPWFSRAHPDALPVTAEGVRLVHGSRDTYDPAAPAYRRAAARIAQVLLDRFGDHPALIGWHVHNEYGTVGFGEHVAVAFRAWLRRRYGTLESLNAAWLTAFWSQGYGDWEEILPPRATQYLPNPTQLLDFKRCTAELLLECFEEQAAVVRAGSRGLPVTTNLILPTWLHDDPWAVGAACDIVAIDHYVDEDGEDGAAQAAFGGDLARSLGGGAPWLLMEQASTWMPAGGRMRARRPGDYLRTSLQHVAHGSVGALTFQWRAPVAGAEFFHSGMVPHAGADTPAFREVVEVGKRLAALGELAEPPVEGPVVRSSIAITWDADAWWAAETRALPSERIDFLRPVHAAHRAVWRAGRVADFVRLDHDLDRYRVLLLPSQLPVSEDEAARVEEWVRRGGTVVVWYFSGSFDRDLHVVLGGYSGRLASLLGIRVTELHPLGAEERIALDNGMSGAVWSEEVRLADAEPVAAFAEGALRGSPAVTRRRLGAGSAYYLATELDGVDLDTLLRGVLDEAGLPPEVPGAGDGVEVIRRAAGDARYLVAINHTEAEREVELHGVSVPDGAALDGTVSLAPGVVIVVREGGSVR
ncbi:beta-galactosidase [Amnibacterium sp.]|uniref:beta-galactosidase n=1 Tax=Amnibacterium sp. TaxID=1872496 RepID=UPI003F7B9A16